MPYVELISCLRDLVSLWCTLKNDLSFEHSDSKFLKRI